MSSSEKKKSADVASQTVIPVVEEEAQIGRRVVDTGKGVRIHKQVSEHEEWIDQPLLQDELRVERVPIGRLVVGNELPAQRTEGDTLIIPVFEEVLVLEKRVRLKEEVRVTRVRQEVRSPQAVKLKSEEVSVERFDEGKAGGRGHG